MNQPHEIIIEMEITWEEEVAPLIRAAIEATLTAQGVTQPCEVNVLCTDDQGIQEVNLDYRNIDAPTDVLSFPMFELTPGQAVEEGCEIDPETGVYPLGDMAISLERAKAQSVEYGHSVSREISYLVVHSVLHLLGYDHMVEEGKNRMREREEAILETMGLLR